MKHNFETWLFLEDYDDSLNDRKIKLCEFMNIVSDAI